MKLFNLDIRKKGRTNLSVRSSSCRWFVASVPQWEISRSRDCREARVLRLGNQCSRTCEKRRSGAGKGRIRGEAAVRERASCAEALRTDSSRKRDRVEECVSRPNCPVGAFAPAPTSSPGTLPADEAYHSTILSTLADASCYVCSRISLSWPSGDPILVPSSRIILGRPMAMSRAPRTRTCANNLINIDHSKFIRYGFSRAKWGVLCIRRICK